MGAEGVFNAFAHVNTHGKGFLEVDAGNMADSCLEVEIKHMANNAVNTDYEVRVDGVLQNIAVNTASGEITITSPPGAPVIRLQYYPHVNFPVGAIDKIYTSYTGPGVRVANNAKLEINTLGKLANLRSDDLQIVVTNRGLGNFGASLIYKGVLYNMETTYISDTMLMLNGPVGSAIDGLSIVYSSDVALDENQSNIFTNLTFGKSPYNKEYNNINNITSTLASEIRRQESKLTNLATKSTKLKARREEAVNKAVMKAQMLEMKKQMAEQTMKMISTILTGAASAA
ncbi:MAG UNVERIFIED_CONTAM: hypothetical protein LVQ98_05245 [Rickettsiaceae bacterium]|jgi:hypothetical protein